MKSHFISALFFTLISVGVVNAANDVFYTASAQPSDNPDSTQGVDVWTTVLNNGGNYYSSGAPVGWAIWGNGDHLTTSATYTFAGGALTNMQTISMDYAHGDNIDTGYRVGIRLLDAAGTVQAEFSYLGGGGFFQSYDTGSGYYQDTGKSYDSKHFFNISYTIGVGDTNYTAVATVGSTGGGGSGSWSGTFLNPIAKIQVFTEGGWNSDQFFNNLQIITAGVCPPISLGNIVSNPLKNSAYTNTFSASGGVAPYSYLVTGGSLPAGLNLSAAGVLSGTPTTDGVSTFTVQASDNNGCTGSRSYTLRVYKSGVDNSGNYSSWTGNGGTGFGSWDLYANNHGVDFSGAEKTTSGDVNIHAADGSAWKLYAWTGTTNQQWEESIAYRTFTSPLQISNDLFSVSMEMQNGNSGVGNPGQMGFALRNGDATGSGDQTAGARLAVYLTGGSNNVVVEDASGAFETTVPGGLGSAYDFTVRMTSGNDYELTITRYTNNTGSAAAPVTLIGTLAGSGSIDSFSLFNWKNATNANGNSDAYFNKVAYSSANFICPTITMKTLPPPVVETPYSADLGASAGLAPYAYSLVDGALPDGLSLSPGGVLSGTPTTIGASTFTVMVTDANNCTGTRAYTLTTYAAGDNSANYSSWVNGTNAGNGFGPWDFYSDTHGGNNSYAGLEKTSAGANIQSGDGSVWKLYAIGFGSTAWEEAEAYRKFNTPLSVAGDQFAISFQNGSVGIPGQVGFALRNGDYTGSGGFSGRARLQVYFGGGDTNLTVWDASGSHQIPGLGFTSYGWDVIVTLTGPDAYSLTVTRYNGIGTADAPVTVTGPLAGSGPIDSLAMFNWNYDLTSGVNGDSYFNNLAYTSTTSLITNNVTFQVDMTAQLFAGKFDPSSDVVGVRGSFNDWAGGLTLTNNPGAVNTNIYSAIVPIIGALYSGESYKFVFTNMSTGAQTWESSTPKSSTLDTGYADYNRFFQLTNSTAMTRPSVLFDDKELNDYLQSDMSVTFSVNMNGAHTTDGYAFGTSGSDTVWFNAAFIPWYPWYDPLDPLSTIGPAQYQMTDSGGGIYTVAFTIPKGTPVAIEYKYGIGIGTNSPADYGPRDNEAGVNDNHFRVIRSTATGSYAMPQDTFGNQYHEPFFSPTEKTGGQLSIGSPSGGTIPVSWLGRPGAHLQTTTDLAGPWTDQLNTDGTNWTSGVNTTNGLMSVTNWPSAGKTFFRLFKP